MVKSKEHEEGNRLFGEKKYDEAIACYSAAIALDPSFYVLYSNRSKSYYYVEKYDTALEDIEKCLSLNDTFVKGYNNKALILDKMGRRKEAHDALNEIKELEKAASVDMNKSLLEYYSRKDHNYLTNYIHVIEGGAARFENYSNTISFNISNDNTNNNNIIGVCVSRLENCSLVILHHGNRISFVHLDYVTSFIDEVNWVRGCDDNKIKVEAIILYGTMADIQTLHVAEHKDELLQNINYSTYPTQVSSYMITLPSLRIEEPAPGLMIGRFPPDTPKRALRHSITAFALPRQAYPHYHDQQWQPIPPISSEIRELYERPVLNHKTSLLLAKKYYRYMSKFSAQVSDEDIKEQKLGAMPDIMDLIKTIKQNANKLAITLY